MAEVSQETIPVVFEFSGTLQAIRSVDIVPRVGGYIEARYFVEGTPVKKGDPLYLIDPRPFETTLAGDKAQLQRDEAIALLERAVEINPSRKPLAGLLERSLDLDGEHAGTIHYYVHAVEASDNPYRARPYARILASTAPGIAHLVHMGVRSAREAGAAV